jgi:thiamine pyrophosphokinase
MILIVSGGDAPAPDFLKGRAEKAGKVIAADRGAEYCLAAGIRPDLVVGDMDSVSPSVLRELSEAGTTLKRHAPEKDETDTRLALDEALAMGGRSIEILAGTGSRIDHSLANIHLFFCPLRRRRGLHRLTRV